MQRRILLIAVVFVAGFGIGYGITWLFVGSPERGGTDTQRIAERERPDAKAPEQPTADAGAVVPSPDPQAADPDTAVEAPTPDIAVAAADTAPVEPEAVAAPEVAPAPRDVDRCLNKVCRIDFGGVSGGISVRKGKLEHGTEVVWDRDFGRADKVGTLDSGRNVRVEVLGIGLTDGEPSAAYIVRKVKRGPQHGVIALKIGDRRISLVPVDE